MKLLYRVIAYSELLAGHENIHFLSHWPISTLFFGQETLNTAVPTFARLPFSTACVNGSLGF